MSEIRLCRGTWVYCDGQCHNCTFIATTTTTGVGTYTTPPIMAQWIWNTEVRCSHCNYKLETTGLSDRCPHCGASMILIKP